jgi:hypothetical protein
MNDVINVIILNSLVLQYNIGQSGGTVGDDLNVVPVWIQGVSGQNTAALVIDNGMNYLLPM